MNIDFRQTNIKSRFLVSLIGNLIRSSISFVTIILLARWLGPQEFGRMAFLLATFLAFQQLFDMASSSALFTFLSQRQRSNRIIRFFSFWVLFQLLLSIAIVLILLPDTILKSIWLGEDKTIIVLALIATFMKQHAWTISSKIAESQRKTFDIHKLNVIVSIIHLIVVILLWNEEMLALPFIFLAVIIEWGIASWLASKLYRTNKYMSIEGKNEDYKSIFNEFWKYCLPFLPYVWIGFFYDFLDRWMLQNWGGNNEQAYYAIALQFSSITILISASILRIFWKEIAEAQYQKDYERVKNLYTNIVKGLYFVALLLAGGLIPWSKEILVTFLGGEYEAGLFAFTLMLLYPIHQVIGQMNGSLLYATEKSKLQVIYGSIFMVISIMVAYYLMAPSTLKVPGLNMASEGLAIKMVLMQFIHANFLSWAIAKIFKWEFEWHYQIFGLVVITSISWCLKLLITSFHLSHLMLELIVFYTLYLILILLIGYLLPWVFGFNRHELDYYIGILRRKID